MTYETTSYNSYSGYVTIPSTATRGSLYPVDYEVVRIGNYAFCWSQNLTGIHIPTSINSIGQSAFSCCTSLSSVTIPYSVKTIDYNAFGDCDNLTSVTIGDGLTYIGTYGFDSPLTYICIYTRTPPTINSENAFKESTYNNADLIIPDGSYSAYKNAPYWSKFKKMRTVSAVPINSTNFPDDNFRTELLMLHPSGYISDIDLITEVHVEGRNYSNLKGIELFTNLEKLYCYDNNLTSLDLSNCTKLKYLACGNNKLTSLYLNNKSQLYYLDCHNNPQLRTLSCYRCALTTLNVSGCTALDDLQCYENANLTSITGLADCTAMTYIDCEDCKIADLSAVNSMSNLERLYCRNNKLTSLTVTDKS